MATIIFSLIDEQHRLGTELSPKELAAIGYVTASWAQLEHLLLDTTIAVAETANVALPEAATSLSFKKRLRALRELVREVIEPEAQNRLLAVLSKVGSAERSRHRITHGLWDWLPKNPNKLRASSYRNSLEFEEPFDFGKLLKLGDTIGEINFQLRYPGGKKQAEEELANRHFAMSRIGAQLFSGQGFAEILPDIPADPKQK